MNISKNTMFLFRALGKLSNRYISMFNSNVTTQCRCYNLNRYGLRTLR